MPLTSSRLLLIGCGKMGAALARGWSKAKTAAIDVVEPGTLPRDVKAHIHQSVHSLQALGASPAPYTAIILAVKPDKIDSACEDLAAHPALYGANTLFLSIAAGRTTSSLATHLPGHAAIVRAMPNLPASIGMGVTALYTATTTPPPIRFLAESLGRAVGDIVWIDNEAAMDTVTAVSGSGPAYVFLLIETMAQAGVTLGLTKDVALRLARQTVVGAAQLAAQSPDIAPATLRENVTSPNGTTAAALSVLMEANKGIDDLFTRAITAARDRSHALSK